MEWDLNRRDGDNYCRSTVSLPDLRLRDLVSTQCLYTTSIEKYDLNMCSCQPFHFS